MAARPLGDGLTRDQRGVHLRQHRVDVDDHATDVGAARQLVHRVEQHLFENGAQKQTVYEDTEEPNGLYADRGWPDGQDGDLYKVEDWFEFNDEGNPPAEATAANTASVSPRRTLRHSPTLLVPCSDGASGSMASSGSKTAGSRS